MYLLQNESTPDPKKDNLEDKKTKADKESAGGSLLKVEEVPEQRNHSPTTDMHNLVSDLNSFLTTTHKVSNL
jgi:hypothetical protein